MSFSIKKMDLDSSNKFSLDSVLSVVPHHFCFLKTVSLARRVFSFAWLHSPHTTGSVRLSRASLLHNGAGIAWQQTVERDEQKQNGLNEARSALSIASEF